MLESLEGVLLVSAPTDEMKEPGNGHHHRRGTQFLTLKRGKIQIEAGKRATTHTHPGHHTHPRVTQQARPLINAPQPMKRRSGTRGRRGAVTAEVNHTQD